MEVSNHYENKYNLADKDKLTEGELKVLEACLDPMLTGKTVVDKCKAVGISRDTWYKAFHNPIFVKVLNEANIELVKANVSDVVKACVKFAVSSSKNSADRKMLLTMAGLYTDKQEVNANITGEVENRIDLTGYTVDEIKEMLGNNCSK